MNNLVIEVFGLGVFLHFIAPQGIELNAIAFKNNL